MIQTKTKKKIRLTAILVILFILIALGFLMYRISNQSKWVNTSLTYELGEKVKIKDTDVLNKSDSSFTIDTSSIDQNKVGAYVAKASIQTVKGKQIRNIEVSIKDTTAPKFTEAPKTIKVNYGDSDYNFQKKFKASDLSKVNISINKQKVDFNTPGKYKATVRAEDVYGNVTKKKFTVVVRDYYDYVYEQEDEDVQGSQNDSSYTQQVPNKQTTQSNEDSSSSSSNTQISPDNYDTSQYANQANQGFHVGESV